jgi:hypothetical protein
MPWSIVNFGKYSGKTLPQILFSDPDWFFWAVEHDVFHKRGPLDREAERLNARARSIRIPHNDAGKLEAEYIVHSPTYKFGQMDVVPASRPEHRGSSPTFRKKVIDLSVAHGISPYDKLGSRRLISSVKYALFGDESARMSQKRCGEFFDDLTNFVL